MSSKSGDRSIIYFLLVLSLTSPVAIFLMMKGYIGYSLMTLGIIAGLAIESIRLAKSRGKYLREEIAAASTRITCSETVRRAVDFVFALALFVALLETLIFHAKDVSYYASISVCSGAVISRVILAEHNRMNAAISTLQILVVSAVISLSNQAVFPLGIGASDSRYHINSMIYPIISTGKIPVDTDYTFFPGHQLLVSTASFLTGIPPAMTYFVAGGLMIVFSSLLIIAFGARYFGFGFAAISAVVFINSGYIVYNASHPFQLSFAIPLFVAIIYSGVRHAERGYGAFLIIFCTVSLTLAFSHHFSNAFTAMILFAIVLGAAARLPRITVGRLFRLALILVLVLIVHWLYYAQYLDLLVDVLREELLKMIGFHERLIAPPQRYDELSSYLILLALPSALVLLLSAGTIMNWMFSKRVFAICCVSGSLALLVLMSAGAILNIIFLLSWRILTLFEAAFAPFLCSGTLHRLFKPDSARLGAALTIAIVVVFSFLSNSSPSAGKENPILTGDLPEEKLYDTLEEMEFRSWTSTHLATCPVVYSTPSTYMLDAVVNTTMIPMYRTGEHEGILNDSALSDDALLAITWYDLNVGFFYTYSPESTYQVEILILDESEVALENDYGRVFDSGNVWLFEV